jgi:hypothetical protein
MHSSCALVFITAFLFRLPKRIHGMQAALLMEFREAASSMPILRKESGMVAHACVAPSLIRNRHRQDRKLFTKQNIVLCNI